jgi:hypothetical protein
MSASTPSRRPFVAVVSFMVALTHHARQPALREQWLVALMESQMRERRREWS